MASQMKIPGTESKFPEVDTAAESYVEARDVRMAKTVKEIEARGKLVEVMRKNKLSIYRCGEYVITLTDGKPVVKATRDGGRC